MQKLPALPLKPSIARPDKETERRLCGPLQTYDCLSVQFRSGSVSVGRKRPLDDCFSIKQPFASGGGVTGDGRFETMRRLASDSLNGRSWRKQPFDPYRV